MSKKIKILLVDDSDVMLNHVTALLAKDGHQILGKTNLVHAVEGYLRFLPDAVVCDFILEGNTGLDVLSAIAAALPAGTPMSPATIMTMGPLSDTDQKRADKMSARVLQKPKRGKEEEFLQNFNFWLRENKLC